METAIKKIDTGDAQETLEAACSAINYALSHTQAVRLFKNKQANILTSLVNALSQTNAAKKRKASMGSMRGHIANAVTHLRAALRAMQDISLDEEIVVIVVRATARALLLLYPLIQTEGPILLVARKKRKTHRSPRVRYNPISRRSPVFDIVIGANTETNFYTGFSGDIHSGGLFIATYDIRPIGTAIAVRARLPRGRILKGGATVHWVREYNEASPNIVPGMGAVFSNLCADDYSEIERFLSKRDAIFYEAV